MDTPIIGKEKPKETEESLKTRVANCSKEIEQVLMKYGCTLQVNQGVSVYPVQN